VLKTKFKKLRQLCGFLETFSWLTVKLAVNRPRHLRVLPGLLFRQYAALCGQVDWKSKPIFEIVDVPAGTRIELEHIPGDGINTAVDELAYMAIITRAVRPKAIFEIGTFRGRTALNFALNSPPDCKVWTMDLPPTNRELGSNFNDADRFIVEHSQTGIDYRGKDVERKIQQLFGDSHNFDFSPYFGKIDIVLIDGAHHYEAVIGDTQNALKMLRPGGVILWHDFANYGDYNDVTRAILDTIPADKITQIGATELAVYRADSISIDAPETRIRQPESIRRSQATATPLLLRSSSSK
jgi:predicted O-methyltransferase YrrM